MVSNWFIAIGLIVLVIIIVIQWQLWKKHKKDFVAEMEEKDVILNSLVKNIPGGVAIYKMGKTIETVYSSDGVPALSGRTMAEYTKWVEGDPIGNTIFEDDLPVAKKRIMEAVQKNAPIDLTYRLKHKNGSNVWVQLSAVPIRDDNGISVYYAVYSALPQEALLYRSIVNDAPTGIYICDSSNYSMLYANETVITTLSGDRNYTGKKCYEYIAHLDSPCTWCKMGKMNTKEYLVRDFDVPGRNLHLNMKGKLVNWNGISAHIEYTSDDTYHYNEQKAKEQAYQSQMELLSKLSDGYVCNYRVNLTMDTVSDGFGTNKVIVDKLDNTTDFHDFIDNALMLLPDSKERKEYKRLFNREALIEGFKNGNNNISFEHRTIVKGNVRWCRSSAILVQNPSTGHIEGYASATDIHEQKICQFLTEKSLREYNDILICIDKSNNSHIMFEASDTTRPIYRENSEYAILSCIEKNYANGDIEEFKNKIKLENIVSELENKASYPLFYTLKLDDGLHYKQATYSYLDKECGLIALLVSDITEIHTEQQKLADELANALQEAKNANTAKTEFFSRMSHDMRTPMNGILGMAALSEDENDPVQLKESIAKIKTSGEYLLSLINDTLDFQRIESGKLTLNPKIINCAELVHSILDMVGPAVRSKNINFKINNKNVELDWYIRFDPVRIKQIFINLLSNAIKFTPEGGTISITYECLKRENGISYDRIEISDTGIGMSEDFIKNKIFKPFSQERNTVTGQYAGSGLGLSIVKSLVELMGGTISVKSELGVGTTFTLDIGFPKVEADEITKEKAKQEIQKESISQSLNGKKILLAEDHPLNAEIATRLLKKTGCEVVWTKDGKECVDFFSASPLNSFDVILMDIRMPIMNGLEAATAIRALNREDAKAIPIIAMTANAYDEDVKKSISAGMNEHLAKPVDPEQLYKTIANSLQK